MELIACISYTSVSLKSQAYLNFRYLHVYVLFSFRDIVLASHIKPLQKGDTLENMTFEVKWNPHADKSKPTQTKHNASDIKKVQQ